MLEAIVAGRCAQTVGKMHKARLASCARSSIGASGAGIVAINATSVRVSELRIRVAHLNALSALKHVSVSAGVALVGERALSAAVVTSGALIVLVTVLVSSARGHLAELVCSRLRPSVRARVA